MPSKETFVALHTELNKYLSVKESIKLKRLDNFHYKNYKIKVCKMEYNKKQRRIRLRKNNPFLEFVKMFKDKNLDWYFISKNENITMEIIEQYQNLPWDWNAISYNPNLTTEFIAKYPDKNWFSNDWSKIFCTHEMKSIKNIVLKKASTAYYLNCNIADLIKVKPYLHLLKDNNIYYELSRSKNISIQDIINNQNFQWVWSIVSARSDVTEEILEKNLNLAWDWNVISFNVSIDFILKYPNIAWNWKNVARNNNLNLSFIKINLNKPWIFKDIFEQDLTFKDNSSFSEIIDKFNMNSNLLKEFLNLKLPLKIEVLLTPKMSLDQLETFISKNKMTPYIMSYVSLNTNLTLEFIDKYNFNWVWPRVFRDNGNITKLPCEFLFKHLKDKKIWSAIGNMVDINFIEQYPYLSWDWDLVSSNPDITISFVKRLNKFWSWYNLSSNPGIKISDIIENMHLPWSWENITTNHPDVDIYTIMQNPNLPWAFNSIRYNKKITGKKLKQSYVTIHKFIHAN